MAMIYAQSGSEMQSIMSMPLEYQRADVLDETNSSSTVQCLDGSVICNYSSDPTGINDRMHHSAAVMDSHEDLSCIPLSIPDMPALGTTSGFNEVIAISGRPVIEDNLEQSIDDACFEQQHSEADIGLKGLSWQAFMVDSWFTMCDSQLQDIHYDEVANGLLVEADKGFNFSPWDESFVCQKKNHFQITVQLKLKRQPRYIKTEQHEIEHITSFALHLYGIKFEAPGTSVNIEQSKTDRSKLPYEPIALDFPTASEHVVKATACRLHFSETTANNMRKRGKPNPDQKYFALVVAIHANTTTCDYPVVAYVSERIIVRASNPGQFDNEGDSIWMKSNSGESAFYHGKVGINTESPEETLTVVGNVSITGSLLHPSDKRLKQNIQRMHTKDMLENVCSMNLYSYNFKENAFDSSNSVQADTKEVGLIAQEVQMIIPDAIHEMDFQGTDNVRMINKDRILMELLGAVQELSKEKKGKNNISVSITVALLVTSFLIILLSLLFGRL